MGNRNLDFLPLWCNRQIDPNKPPKREPADKGSRRRRFGPSAQEKVRHPMAKSHDIHLRAPWNSAGPKTYKTSKTINNWPRIARNIRKTYTVENRDKQWTGRRMVKTTSVPTLRLGEGAQVDYVLARHTPETIPNPAANLRPPRNLAHTKITKNIGKTRQNCKNTEIAQISVFRGYSGQTEATMKISGSENVENFKKMYNPPSPAGFRFFSGTFRRPSLGDLKVLPPDPP